jgi:phosphoribosylformylglycinamidine (FGAM) synthase-like amidotransferase family enzyme
MNYDLKNKYYTHVKQMTPPLTHIETIFYQNMQRIRRNNNHWAEELRILIDHHEGDIDCDRDDRMFSRSENEYIIQRYQAELNAVPRYRARTPIVLQGRRVTGASPIYVERISLRR